VIISVVVTIVALASISRSINLFSNITVVTFFFIYLVCSCVVLLFMSKSHEWLMHKLKDI